MDQDVLRAISFTLRFSPETSGEVKSNPKPRATRNEFPNISRTGFHSERCIHRKRDCHSLAVLIVITRIMFKSFSPIEANKGGTRSGARGDEGILATSEF